MRVIGGQYRRTTLNSLDDEALRPMLDRVKESLFNILQSEVTDAVVLDLFSGSGALGIEALSRGARRCTFVEHSRKLGRLIERNLAACGINREEVEIIGCNVLCMKNMAPPAGMAPADLVFLDPPYAMTSDPRRLGDLFLLLEELVGGWISPAGLIMLHHDPASRPSWPSNVFRLRDTRTYGRSQLSFFNVTLDPDNER